MDGECHASLWGRYHFENELGYLAGCLRAMYALMETPDRTMDADLLCQLHDLAVADVFKRGSPPLHARFQLGYRTQPVEFALHLGRNCSAQGAGRVSQLHGRYQRLDRGRTANVRARRTADRTCSQPQAVL